MTVSPSTPTTLLAEEFDTACQLMSLLREEQGMLIKAKIDELDPLVGQKNSLIARLSELSQARLQALSQAGYAQEESSMQAWLDSLSVTDSDKTAAQQTWNALLTLIRSAKELNRVNGMLIGTHLSRNKATLQVIQSNQGDHVYGRDGQTSVQTSRRSLVVG